MFVLLLAVIYLAFISLGLPDSLLGSAWPTMYPELDVPVSFAGIISIIISVGTIFSSLQSDRLTRRFGAGRVTAVSVAMTAAALFAFSVTKYFPLLCLWAVPYGLGAGSVDAALNNYVALHYKSKHMSWLHCMWSVGATVGPYIMGYAISGEGGWSAGYRYISIIQICISAILFLSLRLWKKSATDNIPTGVPSKETNGEASGEASGDARETYSKPLSLRAVLRTPGAKEVMICFFCYCALESTAILWASSYLNLYRGIPAEKAASYAGLFFIGMTVGRAISGFLTMKLNDTQMIRLGQVLIAIGIAALLLPGSDVFALVGLTVIGLGCAPIYPCIIHSTPSRFGADKSQAVIGIQMASAYVGSCIMPPIFGLMANHITVALLPFYLLALLALMAAMHEILGKRTGRTL